MIIIPSRISESFIRDHQEYTFVYGYDRWKRGALGQCVVAVGQPNTYPISTIIKHCASPVYWQDSMLHSAIELIDSEIANIPRDKPIILFPKIGLGCARLKEFAPKILKYIQDELEKIRSNYEFDYYSWQQYSKGLN